MNKLGKFIAIAWDIAKLAVAFGLLVECKTEDWVSLGVAFLLIDTVLKKPRTP